MSTFRERAIVYSSSGTDRLRLILEWDEQGGDFHSVVWEHLEGADWRTVHEISRDKFQWQYPFRRWVSDLHSLSPENATAVMKVAEGDKPAAVNPLEFRTIKFHYSWRLWDLRNNCELKRLMNCDDPFQSYDSQDDES